MRKNLRVLLILMAFISAAAVALLVTKDRTPPAPDITPQQLWERCRATLPPLSYEVLKDETLPFDTDPTRMMRRMEVRFCSQVVGQWRRRMEHTAVIFMPADPSPEMAAERKGRVVIVSHGYGDKTVEGNYGEPIAARMGYPTMVIPIPGEYDGHPGESPWIYFLQSLQRSTQDPINSANFRQAAAYLRALDIFGKVLGQDDVRAVIGGHSKRAPSAFLAAAMDAERIAGVVYMGNEGRITPGGTDYLRPVRTFYVQKHVRCPVIYIGATNEDGYEMFNIARNQAVMERPWTIAQIPNYRHANKSEKQFMNWMMWISHCFEQRPIAQISDLSHTETETGTRFSCTIDTPNKFIMAKAWYVYAEDIPLWRDLMWHPVLLERTEGNRFEGHSSGITPDAWLVEVKDTAMGTPGYVTSLPQDITHKETKNRYSQGSVSRHWRTKTEADIAASAAGELIGEPRVEPPVPRIEVSPTPPELWARFRKTLPPFKYTVKKDEVVASDSDPRQRLRRIEIEYVSQVVEGNRMIHRGIIYMPANPELNQTPERRGKVVIITHGGNIDMMAANIAEPVAARTGYPAMELLLPGDYEQENGEIKWLRYFRSLAKETGDPIYHDFFRSAVPYLQAIDVFSGILKEKKVRAIIGGHSKRAFYAYNAAAIDPERIAGVVYLGCESLYPSLEEYHPSVNPVHIQDFVKCPVLYIGGSDEGGYEMFNITRLQRILRKPWTIEYLPNYRHGDRAERQFIDWRMWTSHIFDGRPVVKISDLEYEETAEGTRFRARIDTPNKIIQAKVWYVYCDDVPLWRDLMWYPRLMHQKEGTLYEGYAEGILPDAWFVEVKDIANGHAGYISSVPQDITHKPTKERIPPRAERLWRPKK